MYERINPVNDQTGVQEGKHGPYTGVRMASPNSPRLKKAKQVKRKVKSLLIIFCDKGDCSE
jgi:hypothetical protein